MLEISETQVARLDAAAWILLKRLRRLGVRVALDNFGGGFGAITQIRDGMFDMVKIDRMLVADLADEPVKRAAVIGAVALANALGLPTVAEYVDGPALVPVLRDLGVRFVQGHGIARPVPWPAIG
jgi:EAL domain-containing protein (putative c-di-GMP-specific phosphodiesterase class I)